MLRLLYERPGVYEEKREEREQKRRPTRFQVVVVTAIESDYIRSETRIDAPIAGRCVVRMTPKPAPDTGTHHG